jgi:hypothetical protein
MRHALRGGPLLFVLALVIALFAASAAHAATITGELIDTYCYAHSRITGQPHAACALKCARVGIPVAVLENGTRRVYVLLPLEDAEPLPPALVAQMAHTVTVDGDVFAVGGSTFLIVRSFRVIR